MKLLYDAHNSAHKQKIKMSVSVKLLGPDWLRNKMMHPRLLRVAKSAAQVMFSSWFSPCNCNVTYGRQKRRGGTTNFDSPLQRRSLQSSIHIPPTQRTLMLACGHRRVTIQAATHILSCGRDRSTMQLLSCGADEATIQLPSP